MRTYWAASCKRRWAISGNIASRARLASAFASLINFLLSTGAAADGCARGSWGRCPQAYCAVRFVAFDARKNDPDAWRWGCVAESLSENLSRSALPLVPAFSKQSLSKHRKSRGLAYDGFGL